MVKRITTFDRLLSIQSRFVSCFGLVCFQYQFICTSHLRRFLFMHLYQNMEAFLNQKFTVWSKLIGIFLVPIIKFHKKILLSKNKFYLLCYEFQSSRFTRSMIFLLLLCKMTSRFFQFSNFQFFFFNKLNTATMN